MLVDGGDGAKNWIVPLGDNGRGRHLHRATELISAAADLLSTLKLNAQQTTSIKTILDADRAAFEELRQTMRTKSDALQVATKQKLAKILNAEQLGRYEEFKRANRPPRPQGEPPRRDEK